MTNKLNVNSHIKPVQQKIRKFAPERNETIREEIEQLLTAIIFEVKYPTLLTNPVMVKKLDGG